MAYMTDNEFQNLVDEVLRIVKEWLYVNSWGSIKTE